MKIDELYNELTKIQSLSIKEREKEREAINLVNKYSSKNKISFEKSLEHLDSYANSLKE